MGIEEPQALHGESTNLEPAPRVLTIEEAIMRQIDRIGYLRSIGQDWAEPLFHLRDLIVGLEDDEFWTGIPKTKTKAPKEELDAYRERGWLSIRVRERVKKEGDREYRFPDPTPSELALMLRIIMGLLARQGMTWRRKNTDEIQSKFEVTA